MVTLISFENLYQIFLQLIKNPLYYTQNQNNHEYLNKIPLPEIIQHFYKYTNIYDNIPLKFNWNLEPLSENIEFMNKYKYLLPIMNKRYRHRIYYVMFILKSNPEYIYIGFEKFNSNRYQEKYSELNPPNNKLINFNQFIISNMNLELFSQQIDSEIL